MGLVTARQCWRATLPLLPSDSVCILTIGQPVGRVLVFALVLGRHCLVLKGPCSPKFEDFPPLKRSVRVTGRRCYRIFAYITRYLTNFTTNRVWTCQRTMFAAGRSDIMVGGSLCDRLAIDSYVYTLHSLPVVGYRCCITLVRMSSPKSQTDSS